MYQGQREKLMEDSKKNGLRQEMLEHLYLYQGGDTVCNICLTMFVDLGGVSSSHRLVDAPGFSVGVWWAS